MNSPTFQARRLIFMLDGSNNVDSRKDVPFVGFIDIVPHFGMKYPKTPNFGAQIGVFKPNKQIFEF